MRTHLEPLHINNEIETFETIDVWNGTKYLFSFRFANYFPKCSTFHPLQASFSKITLYSDRPNIIQIQSDKFNDDN